MKKKLYLAYHRLPDCPLIFKTLVGEIVKGLQAVPEIRLQWSGQHPDDPEASDHFWYRRDMPFILEADLLIVLLDYEKNIPVLERAVAARSADDKPLWCFVPRDAAITKPMADAINGHIIRTMKVGKRGTPPAYSPIVQSAFCYDPSAGEVLRMAERWLAA